MKKFVKRSLITLAVLLLLAMPGYYFLVLQSPTPNAPGYTLDIDSARQLANALPGEKPSEIRVEHVATLRFAEAMVMAGEPWQGTPIPVYSYQILLPNELGDSLPAKTLIVDTALADTDGLPGFMVDGYFDEAYQRMSRAISSAEQIVITHEHFDHIDGIASHPALADLLPKIRLTREQYESADRMAPSELPANIFLGYEPLQYEHMLAIAPGVVLIKAPGHTPGSQMVFIEKADGSEILLLGDVAWQMRNIAYVRERPLFMTALIKEDRNQVINQFQALNQLRQQEPSIHMVPGHDKTVVDQLLEQGILTHSFVIGQE